MIKIKKVALVFACMQIKFMTAIFAAPKIRRVQLSPTPTRSLPQAPQTIESTTDFIARALSEFLNFKSTLIQNIVSEANSSSNTTNLSLLLAEIDRRWPLLLTPARQLIMNNFVNIYQAIIDSLLPNNINWKNLKTVASISTLSLVGAEPERSRSVATPQTKTISATTVNSNFVRKKRTGTR